MITTIVAALILFVLIILAILIGWILRIMLEVKAFEKKLRQAIAELKQRLSKIRE